jgi:hypothetical protein
MGISTELDTPLTASAVVRVHRMTTETSYQEVAEEVLIPDDRGNMRPGQMVDNKLSGMMPGASLPVSQLRYSELISRRS